jgi:hypothetical protein
MVSRSAISVLFRKGSFFSGEWPTGTRFNVDRLVGLFFGKILLTTLVAR